MRGILLFLSHDGLGLCSPSLKWKALEPGDRFIEPRGISAAQNEVSEQSVPFVLNETVVLS